MRCKEASGMMTTIHTLFTYLKTPYQLQGLYSVKWHKIKNLEKKLNLSKQQNQNITCYYCVRLF